MAWHTAHFPVPSDHFCLTESLSSYFVVLTVHSKLWNQISHSVNYLGTQGFPARSHLRNQSLFIFTYSRPARLRGTETSVKHCAQRVDNEGHDIPLCIKHEELKTKAPTLRARLSGRVQKEDMCSQKRVNDEALWRSSQGRVRVGSVYYQHQDRWRRQHRNDAVTERHGRLPESQNKLCENCISYTSPTSFIGHCGGGSCMFSFQKMSAAKWEPSNMNWYSLHTTRHIKAHITDFKFYLHASI